MSFMDKLRKSVDDAVEKARPMVNEAVEKAKPMVADAVEKSKTAVGENAGKVNSAIDTVAKTADKRTHGRYSDQISNLTKNAKREVVDLEKDESDTPAAAVPAVAPEPVVTDADVVEGDEAGGPTV